MKNKKLTLTIIGVVALVLITIGLSYAYWLITKTQTNSNLITSACLDISITSEKDDIWLEQQYPMSDTDGLALTPYTFTVTNNCNVALDYQINLEATGTESSALAASSLKVALDDSISLLSGNTTTTTTVTGAYASYILGYGTLEASSTTATTDSATHTVKMWIDADAPISERNKTFASKVTVTIGQGIEAPTLRTTILANAEAGGYLYSTTPDFSKVTTEGEHGLYQAQDNDGLSYYFRGDTENNYVQLGYTGKYESITKVNYYYQYLVLSEDCYEDECWNDTEKSGEFATLEECEADLETTLSDGYYESGSCEENTTTYQVATKDGDPMYWRIVRINGDGSIRLVYDGTEKVHNGTAHTTAIVYYDGSSTSDWYDKHIKYLFDNYVTNTGFCYDGTEYSNDCSTYISDDGMSCGDDGASYNITFNPYNRLITNKNPILTCPRNIENNKIGILSADEAAMAGGVYQVANNSYYLYSSEISALESKAYFATDLGAPDTFAIDSDGSIVTGNYSDNSASLSDSIVYYNIKPVINIKDDLPFTGNGSFDAPYVITIN